MANHGKDVWGAELGDGVFEERGCGVYTTWLLGIVPRINVIAAGLAMALHVDWLRLRIHLLDAPWWLD